MRQRAYDTAWIRGRERRSFRVFAFNRDEAYVASLRALEQLGEIPREWWYVGAEMAR